MYSERDLNAVNRRIRACALATGLVAAALLALYVAGLIWRAQWLVTASGVLLFGAVTFGVAYFLLPNLRYRQFLVELRQGLKHELAGRVEAISDAAELQDGARVLPVRLRLDGGEDERIVYLNASKREAFPGVGEEARLRLCGRHIIEVLA